MTTKNNRHFRPAGTDPGSRPSAAVIGYGHAGRMFHSYLLQLTPALELHGICSRNPRTRERIIEERSCRTYSSYAEVISDPDVHLVILATPSHLHAEQAVQALEAGKHVVTDKPMCSNLTEYHRMLKACRDSPGILSVFHNRRWDGDFRTVKNLIAEGRIGKIRKIEMVWGGCRMPGGWRGEAASAGGRIYDLGSHMIDQLCQLLPQPITSVYSRLQYDSPGHDVESDAMIIVGFADGATGIVETGSLAYIRKPRFRITGLEGTFVKYGLDPQEACMKAGNIDAAKEPEELFGTLNTTGKTHDDETVPTVPGRWRDFYEKIAAKLNGEGPNPVPPESVYRTTAVIDAAFESHRTGEVVHREIIAPEPHQPSVEPENDRNRAPPGIPI